MPSMKAAGSPGATSTTRKITSDATARLTASEAMRLSV
jgi:hypothetical protein